MIAWKLYTFYHERPPLATHEEKKNTKKPPIPAFQDEKLVISCI
jgi:hypothetical protein